MSNPVNITIEEQELIDGYLHNRLSLAELELFKERLEADDEWRQKVTQAELLSVGIAEVQLKEKMEAFHAGIADRKTTAVVKKIPAATKWLAAAAVLAAVMLAGKFLFFNQSANQRLFADFYKQDPGLATEMGVSDNYNFDRAMVDYKTGQFENAITEWKKLLATHPQNDTLNYFIASAQMGNSEWEPAIEFFNKVIAQPVSSFKNDAYWYKGMALLRLNKTAEAIASIEAGDHPKKDALISKLKK